MGDPPALPGVLALTTKSTVTSGGTGSDSQTWLIALTHAGEPSSPAQEFRMVEADDVGLTPSGKTGTAHCYLATTAAFTASTIGGKSFVFAEQGRNSSGIPKEYVGRFTASAATGTGASAKGTIAKGYMDGMRLDQAGNSGGAFTGAYTGPNSNGRFTLSSTPSGSTASITTAAYIVDVNRMFLLETAGDTGVLSGEMRTQQQATYSDASFNGAAVFSAQGIEYSDSQISGYDSALYRVTGNGGGTLTVNQGYDNSNGVYAAGKENKSALAVTFDSSYPGRATFSPGSDSAFLYFYDANSAFFLDLNGDGNPNYLESGLLEPQTQKTFTDATVAGSYMLAELPLSADSHTVGEVSVSSTGTVSANISKAGENRFSFDQLQSGMTYTWLSTTYGAFTVDGTTCMVVTPASIVCMDQTGSSGSMSVLQQ